MRWPADVRESVHRSPGRFQFGIGVANIGFDACAFALRQIEIAFVGVGGVFGLFLFGRISRFVIVVVLLCIVRVRLFGGVILGFFASAFEAFDVFDGKIERTASASHHDFVARIYLTAKFVEVVLKFFLLRLFSACPSLRLRCAACFSSLSFRSPDPEPEPRTDSPQWTQCSIGRAEELCPRLRWNRARCRV